MERNSIVFQQSQAPAKKQTGFTETHGPPVRSSCLATADEPPILKINVGPNPNDRDLVKVLCQNLYFTAETWMQTIGN